jgi:thiosulfate dehydrogenase
MKRALPLVLLVMAAPIVGCGPQPAAERGAELFGDARLSASPGNVFSCATCHAADAGEGERRLAGHPLAGAAGRPSFWGGKVAYLLDAVNLCVAEFMRGERLGADDPQGLALLAYLRAIAPAPEPAKPLTVVNSIDEAYLGALPAGDGGRGEAGYQAACAPCHGAAHSGDGRLGPRVSILPEDTIRVFPTEARPITAEKVRHGKFFGIAGVMPFFSIERLSDAELADILRYLLP